MDTLDLVTFPGTAVPYYKQEIGTLATTNVELSYTPNDAIRVTGAELGASQDGGSEGGDNGND